MRRDDHEGLAASEAHADAGCGGVVAGPSQDEQRSGGAMTRYGLAGLALISPLAIVACGVFGPPDPGDVLPERYGVPGAEMWCHVLSDDDVGQLIGTSDLSRVGQAALGSPVGEAAEDTTDCRIAWADGDEAVEVASLGVFGEPPFEAESLLNQRVEPGHFAGGEASVMQDGVLLLKYDETHRTAYESSILMDRVCPAAIDDDAYDAVQSLELGFREDLGFDSLDDAELQRIVDRMAEYMDEVLPCPDPEPVTAADIESGTTALDEVDQGSQ